MSRGMPSMVALLGLLAMAGYQNRDKIAEALGGARPAPGGGSPQPQSGAGVMLGGMGGGIGGVLSGGLGELIDRFRQSGHTAAADSWVSTGPNQPIAPAQIEQAIGPDVLKTLSEQTGLSREELLARLTREVPAAVDKFTPNGRLPTADEADRLV